MKVRYSDLARTDVRESRAWYRRESEQAPKEFAAELRRALQRIREHPQIGAPYEHGTRRPVIPRFHHSVVYFVRDEGIYVVAVEHHARDVTYWHASVTGSA